jgi:hypothetical protein
LVQKKLEALAKELWKQRYRCIKAERRLRPEERQALLASLEADPKLGRFRGFLNGVWRLFEDSQDEARAASETLKRQPIDAQRPKPFEKVLCFLEATSPG